VKSFKLRLILISCIAISDELLAEDNFETKKEYVVTFGGCSSEKHQVIRHGFSNEQLMKCIDPEAEGYPYNQCEPDEVLHDGEGLFCLLSHR